MGYNSATGQISGPVSVRDVQRALGSSNNDVGRLCTNTNIKQWAKYRPIQYGTNYIQVLTDAQRANVNYGITNIPIWYGSGSYIANVVDVWVFDATTASKLPNGYSTVPIDGWWARKLPSNGYRLTDFVCGDDHTKGYFLGANEPIGSLYQAFINGGKTNILYNMSTAGVTAGLAITYSDLSEMINRSFQDLYFGVCIVCGTQSSRTIYIATQDNKVGAIDGSTNTLWSMGAIVRFMVNSSSGALYTYMDNGTPFYVFPIITSRKNYVENSYITPTGSAAGDVFIPLKPKESVTLQNFYVEGVITEFNAYRLTYPTSDRKTYCQFYITNNDTETSRYFRYKLTLYDGNGNELATSYPAQISFNAGEQKFFDTYVEPTQYYDQASTMKLEVFPQVASGILYRNTMAIDAVDRELPK